MSCSVRCDSYRAHRLALVAVVADVEEDLLKPAIDGTLGVLKSASKTSSVRRVVVTSSFSAVVDMKKGFRPGYTYTSVSYLFPFFVPDLS
jgi:nucleoside-diphosphate-sugar epimerase